MKKTIKYASKWLEMNNIRSTALENSLTISVGENEQFEIEVSDRELNYLACSFLESEIEGVKNEL